MTTAGVVTNFHAPGIRRPIGITTGPDGALWFSSNGSSAIGRLSTGGGLRLFRSAAISRPRDITLGRDGALWFTNASPVPNENPIGRITAAGTTRSYPVEGVHDAFAIASGPGSSLSFTNASAHLVGEITTSGAVSNRIVGAAPLGIANAPDHTLWFTSRSDDAVASISATGTARRYTDPNDEPDRNVAAGKRLFRSAGAEAVTASPTQVRPAAWGPISTT